MSIIGVKTQKLIFRKLIYVKVSVLNTLLGTTFLTLILGTRLVRTWETKNHSQYFIQDIAETTTQAILQLSSVFVSETKIDSYEID